ncbi:MAG: DUF5060 domain-containing protein [Pseudomonadota bacterium]
MYLTGDAMQWHKLTLNFEGPTLSEDPQTFLDHRLDVTFTHESGEIIKVPGYFAADGDAANTGATTGNLWQVNFNPPMTGDWTWTAEFRVGDEIAVRSAEGQSGGFFDGDSGSLSIDDSDKSGLDLRGKGVLEYDGGQYLSFAGTGETFLKSGVGSPENFLGYSGFDDTPDSHDYAPHLGDFNAGDPTWDGGKGKGIIGAVNYLSEHEVNSAYMMLMNIAGDGRDVSPWTDTSLYNINKNASPDLDERAQSFDVSKLDQWEIVFGHMQEKGINLHLFLQETENDQLLNNGELGTERMLYMREMVARFGHHNGLIWNLGEENTNSAGQIRDHSEYLKSLDPYDHAVALHTYPNQHDRYENYEGSDTLDVLSFQTSNEKGVPDLDRYLEGAEDAGRPVAAFLDEPGNAGVGLAAEGDPSWQSNHASLREVLWKSYAEGAGGAEWYFGYQSANGQGGDLAMEDFSLRESAYEWAASAREFFEQLPLEDMRDGDQLTSGAETYGLALNGAVYAYYLPDGGQATLDLSGESGTYNVGWYDVIKGGALATGTVGSVDGGGQQGLGLPPGNAGGEWAVLVWNPDVFDFDAPEDTTPPSPPDVTPPPATDATWEAQDGKIVMQAEKGVPTDPDNAGHANWKISDTLNGHTGDGYLHWDGPDLFNKPGSGALSYEFEVSEEGTYKLGILGSRPDNGARSDLNNDFFVRMDGGPWKKVFFGGERETWNWGKTFDVNHEKSPAGYELEPGKHVFEISGRSTDAYLDKIHLTLGTLDQNKSAPETLADQTPEPEVPDVPEAPDVPDVPDAPEVPNPPTAPATPTVTLRLVDIATGETISTLASGDTLDPDVIGDGNVTIVADVDGNVGSVRFTLGDHTQVENVAPYALFGDTNGTYRDGAAPAFDAAGDYALTVELFSARNASAGKLGEIETVFSVEEVAAPPPPPAPEPEEPEMPEPPDAPEEPDEPEVPEQPDAPEEPDEPATPPAAEDPSAPPAADAPTSVFLVDTLSDEKLMELGENTVLHKSVMDGRALSVASEVDEAQLDVASASMSFDGTETRIENVEPYALFGDRSGDFMGALEMQPDFTHEIKIDYYDERQANGDLIHEDTIWLETDGNDKLSGRADADDLFGIDAGKLGAVSIYGFGSGDSVADTGEGLIDLLANGQKVGDDWVIDFGGGNRLTLLEYDAEDDPLLM